MQLEINKEELSNFKELLAKSLQNACEYGAMKLQDLTPIDTKRLFSTTRAGETTIRDSSISCEIIAGGLRVKGVLKEQGLERDVDYAIFVENREGYITNNLGAIGKTVRENL